MLIEVPKGVLELLASSEPDENHSENGPGEIVCPCCHAAANMRWRYGVRLDSPEDISHDPDCPAIWAREVLGTTPTPPTDAPPTKRTEG